MSAKKVNSPKNILLIDDNDSIRDSLDIVFRDQNYVLDYADNCAAATRKLKAGGVYDLIIMDLMMPGMGGEKCLPAFKKMGVSAPVVVLTAIKHQEASKDLIRKGAADYITKPWSKNKDVLEVVERMLAKKGTG